MYNRMIDAILAAEVEHEHQLGNDAPTTTRATRAETATATATRENKKRKERNENHPSPPPSTTAAAAGPEQAILCRDCGKTGAAPFHFVYHKCPQADCGSYNTVLK